MDEHRTRHGDAPQSLGDVITRLVALRGYDRQGGDRQMSQWWRSAAGEEIHSRTRVLGLRNGVLVIGVGNSALLSELTAFHKHDLLQRVREQTGDDSVQDLRFRLRGNLNSNE